MRSKLIAALVVSSLALNACTANNQQSASANDSANSSQMSTPAVAENFSEVSLPALMQKEIIGSDLIIKNTIGSTSKYIRYSVTYKANELTISGIMNVPKGEGPFPALVLGHGYIDPRIYTSGRGLKREQDYLANQGFIVLHTDYRNHAESDDDPDNAVNLRLGYTIDVIAAAKALRTANIPQIDINRIGYLGRSMGGGIGYNVATVAPNEFDAIVLYAPVSANYVDNFNKWGRGNPDIANPIIEKHGSPESNPEFWKGMSAENYFDRVDDPIMIHHGTNDESCKIEWSQRAVNQLTELNKDVIFHIYEGEQHAFGPQWELSMQRSVEFLNKRLI